MQSTMPASLPNGMLASGSVASASESKEKEAATSSPTRPMSSILGVGPKVPMGQELLHVNPPKLDDYNSDDEEDEDEDDTRLVILDYK